LKVIPWYHLVDCA